MFIILPTTSLQVDPDKTKCTGDDGVSDNIPFVSVNLSFFRLMHWLNIVFLLYVRKAKEDPLRFL